MIRQGRLQTDLERRWPVLLRQERAKSSIKVLLINVGRSYTAQDMAYATAKHLGADILIVCDPNKKRVEGVNWLKDNRTNVAVLFLNRGLEVVSHKRRGGGGRSI
ncbi:hypothetical protein QE152_g5884 [Popillia japonica]|uniref:Uncharacterized protein n=1 Tax=Popillia japonica TaxID=7064 RepID=A0AAW1ML57_POPJA